MIEKKLEIIVGADGRYTCNLSYGNQLQCGLAGDWSSALKFVNQLAPFDSARAQQWPPTETCAPSGLSGWVLEGQRQRETRLQCVNLAVQAGVPSDKVIEWASKMADWVACKPAG